MTEAGGHKIRNIYTGWNEIRDERRKRKKERKYLMYEYSVCMSKYDNVKKKSGNRQPLRRLYLGGFNARRTLLAYSAPTT